MKRIVLDHTRQLCAERDFYRKLLCQIAKRKRKTLEQRIASSGLMFWDSIQEEKQNAHPHGRAPARIVQGVVGSLDSEGGQQ